MDGSILVPLSLASLVVAMILTLYDMRSSLRPVRCPDCAHCRALVEDEARTQERLTREYARKIGLQDDDDDRRIG
jgi:hypothetical protein